MAPSPIQADSLTPRERNVITLYRVMCDHERWERHLEEHFQSVDPQITYGLWLRFKKGLLRLLQA